LQKIYFKASEILEPLADREKEKFRVCIGGKPVLQATVTVCLTKIVTAVELVM
jgi:hypothetical protein